MKNDFVVKLFEKDEKKVLLKVATALCVGAFILLTLVSWVRKACET